MRLTVAGETLRFVRVIVDHNVRYRKYRRHQLRTGALTAFAIAAVHESANGLGCVKTSVPEEGAESFSLLSSSDSARRYFCFLKLTMSRGSFYPSI